ncbi:MAG: hypothetical protein ACK559_00740, partial [bacterium]
DRTAEALLHHHDAAPFVGRLDAVPVVVDPHVLDHGASVEEEGLAVPHEVDEAVRPLFRLLAEEEVAGDPRPELLARLVLGGGRGIVLEAERVQHAVVRGEEHDRGHVVGLEG